MKPEEINAIVKTTVEETFKELKKESPIKCYFCQSPEKNELHDLQHTFVGDQMVFTKRVNGVIWTIVKALAVALAFYLFAVFGFKFK